MAQKRTKGNRTKSGKKKKATTVAERNAAIGGREANTRIMDRVNHYNAAIYEGGGHGKECVDGAGILFLCGCFSGQGFEARDYLAAYREYEELYAWRYPFRLVRTANFERVDRTTGDGMTDQDRWRLERFRKLDEALGVGNTPERCAMRAIMFDGEFNHGIPYWVCKFENEFRAGHEMPVAGELPDPTDRRLLNSLIRALAAVYDSGIPSRYQGRLAA
jgi:hypothetical protein